MIPWKDVDLENCPVAGALDLIGDRWSMLILREAMSGLNRFDELVDHIGIGRSTLTERMRRLVRAGLLTERTYQEPGSRPRVEYRLTAKGWDLRNVIIALREWGDRHVIAADDRPLKLIDAASGSPLHLALVDDHDRVVPDDRVRAAAGPGLRRRARAR